jgi:hypothetical protein
MLIIKLLAKLLNKRRQILISTTINVMLKRLTILFLLLHASILFAQKIKNTSSICFFQDGKTGKPITIVDDKLVYRGELKNPIQLKHTDYPETLSQYSYNYIINKRTYLVHNGCGPVLEYRNDSIVRIDNSFLQKNQYYGNPFIYDNQMHLLGGYGLFTYKNIITKYDFKTKEWNELLTNSDDRPIPKSNSKLILIEDNLYLFSGSYNNKKGNPFRTTKDDAVWSYNLKTNNYLKLGIFKTKLLETFDKLNYYQANNKLYFILEELIYEIDIVNNKLNYFNNYSKIIPTYLFYDQKTATVFVLHALPSTNELSLESIKLSELLSSKSFKNETLYSDSAFSTFWHSYNIYFGLAFFLTLSLIGIRKVKRKRNLNYIVYDQKKNQVYYKFNIPLNLDTMEEKLLLHLFKSNTDYIQLNVLNIYFENKNQENFNLIVKKRDQLLNSLSYKLHLLLQVNQKALVLEQKNITDKRIKEIRLNPQFFKIK